MQVLECVKASMPKHHTAGEIRRKQKGWIHAHVASFLPLGSPSSWGVAI